ncbi:MAG: hypothetical protein IJZ55_04735 [Lachnospiraceae bacterium]|nr:hypothetical protein [Lachnospiraceae bacterium]
MHKILSYAKSHIYELHALLVATFVVVLMSLIKGPIKRKLVQSVDRKIAKRPKLAGKRKKLIRRKNMHLIYLTMLLSIGVFALVAKLSPLIDFSFPTAVMSGVFALCEYAFFDQITFDIREEGEDE